MYKNNPMDKEDGEEVPSWLKDENVMGGSAPKPSSMAMASPSKPLGPSTSYGGQSGGSNNSSSNNIVEVDYGDATDDDTLGDGQHQQQEQSGKEVDTSWAVEAGGNGSGNGSGDSKTNANYGSTNIHAQKSEFESSSEDDSEDSSSSDDSDSSSSSDDELQADSWQDEEKSLVKKKKKKRSKAKARSKSKKNGSRGSSKWHKEEEEEEDDEEFSDEEHPEELVRPMRNCCHSFFIFIQIFAIIANLCMISIEIVPMYVGTLKRLDIILRCYFAFFCTFFILAEFELFQSSLNNWMLRGFLYTFLGMVSKEQHVAMLANETLIAPKQYWNDVKWPSIFVEVTSWSFMGIGCLYFLLGVFCLKALRDRFRNKFQTRMRVYKGR